jgi:hypothetical protein
VGLRIVELLPPFPAEPVPGVSLVLKDRPRLLEGLPQVVRRPFSRRGALRYGTAAFAERYAEARGQHLEPTGETPRGTWALDHLVDSRSHSFMKGPIAEGLNGMTFFGEAAVSTGGGSLWEGRTLVVCPLGTVRALETGMACIWRVTRVRFTSHEGLTVVDVGDARFAGRFSVTLADPEATTAAAAFAAALTFEVWLALV